MCVFRGGAEMYVCVPGGGAEGQGASPEGDVRLHGGVLAGAGFAVHVHGIDGEVKVRVLLQHFLQYTREQVVLCQFRSLVP